MADEPTAVSDLAWTAFRYAAGELSPDEASAFEGRLDGDQSAREALALAVELSGAAALALADAPIRPARSRGVLRAAGWMTLGAAASALAALALTRSPAPAPPPGPVPAHAAEVAGDPAPVALAWSRLLDDAEEDDEDPPALPVAWFDDAPAPNEPDFARLDDPDGAEPPLPSWLIEAAALRDPAREGA